MDHRQSCRSKGSATCGVTDPSAVAVVVAGTARDGDAHATAAGACRAGSRSPAGAPMRNGRSSARAARTRPAINRHPLPAGADARDRDHRRLACARPARHRQPHAAAARRVRAGASHRAAARAAGRHAARRAGASRLRRRARAARLPGGVLAAAGGIRAGAPRAGNRRRRAVRPAVARHDATGGLRDRSVAAGGSGGGDRHRLAAAGRAPHGERRGGGLRPSRSRWRKCCAIAAT